MQLYRRVRGGGKPCSIGTVLDCEHGHDDDDDGLSFIVADN